MSHSHKAAQGQVTQPLENGELNLIATASMAEEMQTAKAGSVMSAVAAADADVPGKAEEAVELDQAAASLLAIGPILLNAKSSGEDLGNLLGNNLLGHAGIHKPVGMLCQQGLPAIANRRVSEARQQPGLSDDDLSNKNGWLERQGVSAEMMFSESWLS